jgi:lambda family phage tail tape measure protein
VIDIASLGIKVDSTQAAKGATDLDRLAAAAGPAERAVDRLGNTSSRVANQVARQNSAVEQARRISQPAAMNVANLAAQFQDVSVTAAMGQNPLQIALQQGMQISAVLGPMGAAGAVKALGTAFLSVISPVALVTIGLVAAAAAGLQMVNWMNVAKAALNGVANVLKPIAPYAVAAAAGLALIYSPAIVGGIVGMISLLGRLAVSALSAAVAIAAANPGMAFVLGITAAVAAAVIFRDELKQIFGFDIVNDAKNAVNFIIGAFVGGFAGVRKVWGNLPAILGDITIGTANNVVAGVQSMINGAIGLLNRLVDRANSVTSKVGINIGHIGEVDFGKFENPFAGAAADAAKTISSEMAAASKNDWLGGLATGVGKAASKAADMLHGLADSIKSTDKEAEKAAKAAAKRYAGIVRDANQFIASQKVEQSTIGMTAEAANGMRYEQDLLNKAQDAGIKVTGAQRSELSWLARSMAAAEAVTTKLRAAFDFTKDVVKGFASDLRTSLANGEDWWSSFANAGLNALQKIADKLLDMALDQAINGLFKNILGPLFGGIFGGGNVLSGGLALGMGGIGHNAVGNAFANGNVIPFARGTVVNRPTLFPMANGGTGLMGEAGEEAIMPLRRTAGGRLGVEMAGDGGTAVVEVRVTVDDSGTIVPVVKQIAGREADVRVQYYRKHEAPRDVMRLKGKSLVETGSASAR